MKKKIQKVLTLVLSAVLALNVVIDVLPIPLPEDILDPDSQGGLDPQHDQDFGEDL